MKQHNQNLTVSETFSSFRRIIGSVKTKKNEKPFYGRSELLFLASNELFENLVTRHVLVKFHHSLAVPERMFK